MAMRSEVVHLGAVRGVVVDDNQHAQTKPRDRLEVRQPEQRTPVAQRRQQGFPVGAEAHGQTSFGLSR